MADGIVIWSMKPVHQKKVLIKMVEASYLANIPFNCNGSIQYTIGDKEKNSPDQFTLIKKNDSSKFMIFHISNIDEQKSGLDHWIDTKFINWNEESILIPELYRIAVSEDMDDEMTFNFSYFYLKKNREHLISYIDFLLDWDSIKEAYKNGYKTGWYSKERKE